MPEPNRLTRAEGLLYKYADDWLVRIRSVAADNVDVAFNLPHHNLHEKELVTLLFKLFEEGNLVAKRDTVGYFTPTLEQIENAVNELAPNSSQWNPKQETFYGYTSSAVSRYRELDAIYNDEMREK